MLKHAITAIEGKYIDSSKTEDTNLINDDIPTVLQHLFDNYGTVPTSAVKEKEQEV